MELPLTGRIVDLMAGGHTGLTIAITDGTEKLWRPVLKPHRASCHSCSHSLWGKYMGLATLVNDTRDSSLGKPGGNGE